MTVLGYLDLQLPYSREQGECRRPHASSESEHLRHSRGCSVRQDFLPQVFSFLLIRGLVSVSEFAGLAAVAITLEELSAEAFGRRQELHLRSRWARVIARAGLMIAGAEVHVIPAILVSVVWRQSWRLITRLWAAGSVGR